MVLGIVLLAVGRILIAYQSLFIQQDDVVAGSEERATAGILAGFVGVQPQFLREILLVVYEVAHCRIGYEHHLQSMSRRCDEHEDDALPVLLTQLGIGCCPHLTHISLYVVEVYHTQSVQLAMLLLAPASQLLVLEAQRLFIGSYEYHEGQRFLYLIIGGLIPLGQCLTGFSHALGSLRRMDERLKLSSCHFFCGESEISLIAKHSDNCFF